MFGIDFSDIKSEYRQIKGFEDYYITSDGDVYSNRLRQCDKERHLRKMTPKNPGKDSKYLSVILCRDGEQKTFSIHRLVAEYFCPGYFDGAVVNHIDGDNRNNKSSNLEWVTAKENIHSSYLTSGVGAVRNYKIWTLVSPEGIVLGDFVGHCELERFVKESGINVSPTSLTKYKTCNGYTVLTSEKQAKNCNDYRKRVHAG